MTHRLFLSHGPPLRLRLYVSEICLHNSESMEHLRSQADTGLPIWVERTQDQFKKDLPADRRDMDQAGTLNETEQ